MRRISGQRRSRTSKPASVVTWYGVNGWNVAGAYRSASNAGVIGVDTGFYSRVIFRVDSQAASASRWLNSHFLGSGGWFTRLDGFAASLYTTFQSGVPSSINTPTFTVTAPMVGKLIDYVAVHTGAGNLVRAYVNGVEVGSGTAISGFTASAGTQHSVGNRAALSGPAGNCTIFGVAGGDGVPSAAEILAAHNAAKLAGDIGSITGKTDHLWSVKQESQAAIQTTLTDRVGADTLTILDTTGLSIASVAAPQWA